MRERTEIEGRFVCRLNELRICLNAGERWRRMRRVRECERETIEQWTFGDPLGDFSEQTGANFG